MPKIYENLSEQERLEADHNLTGFFGLLMKIDQRNKKEQENNLMKGKNETKQAIQAGNEPETGKTNE